MEAGPDQWGEPVQDGREAAGQLEACVDRRMWASSCNSTIRRFGPASIGRLRVAGSPGARLPRSEGLVMPRSGAVRRPGGSITSGGALEKDGGSSRSLVATDAGAKGCQGARAASATRPRRPRFPRPRAIRREPTTTRRGRGGCGKFHRSRRRRARGAVPRSSREPVSSDSAMVRPRGDPPGRRGAAPRARGRVDPGSLAGKRGGRSRRAANTGESPAGGTTTRTESRSHRRASPPTTDDAGPPTGGAAAPRSTTTGAGAGWPWQSHRRGRRGGRRRGEPAFHVTSPSGGPL